MLTSQRITWICLVGGRILPRLFIISNRQHCLGKLNNDINLTLEPTIFLAVIKRRRCLARGARGMAFIGFLLSLWEIATFSTCNLYYLWPATEQHPQRAWWILHNSSLHPPSTRPYHPLRSPCHGLTVVTWSGVEPKPWMFSRSSQQAIEGSRDFVWNNTQCSQVFETLFKRFVFILSLSSPTQHFKPTGFRCPIYLSSMLPCHLISQHLFWVYWAPPQKLGSLGAPRHLQHPV